MVSYCVKCRDKTPTEKETLHTSKNGRYCLKGACKKCNTNKTQFISEEDAKSTHLLNKASSKTKKGGNGWDDFKNFF